MFKEREVKFDKSRGHVSVEVKNAGFVNLGSFSLHITNGDETRKIGDGKFGDSVPDIFLISIPPDQLENWMLIIIGAYAPTFGHTQISVDYNFFQQGQLSDDSESIRENTVALSTHHDITFKSN